MSKAKGSGSRFRGLGLRGVAFKVKSSGSRFQGPRIRVMMLGLGDMNCGLCGG